MGARRKSVKHSYLRKVVECSSSEGEELILDIAKIKEARPDGKTKSGRAGPQQLR